jgi:hypothetical protein
MSRAYAIDHCTHISNRQALNVRLPRYLKENLQHDTCCMSVYKFILQISFKSLQISTDRKYSRFPSLYCLNNTPH